jgi:nucleoside-diphosphate-sugar epimerase
MERRHRRSARVTDPRLFCFGLGFTGIAVARRLGRLGWTVAGTCRSKDKAARLAGEAIEAHVFTGEAPLSCAQEALAGTIHLLASIAPGEAGDPVLAHHARDLAALAGQLKRITYLSTIAVYGDRRGQWTDEEAPVNPGSERARRRVTAEEAWMSLAERLAVPLDILRLSGIYGPGRSAIDALKAGRARRIVKPGQVFNRIHVEDIAAVVERLCDTDLPGTVYNLADDEPAPPQDVVAFAAGLLGIAPPPEEPFETADMSAMARSFYGEPKRIANTRIRNRLGLALAYPTYREGLAAIAAASLRAETK